MRTRRQSKSLRAHAGSRGRVGCGTRKGRYGWLVLNGIYCHGTVRQRYDTAALQHYGSGTALRHYSQKKSAPHALSESWLMSWVLVKEAAGSWKIVAPLLRVVPHFSVWECLEPASLWVWPVLIGLVWLGWVW